jgi:hypothetical protein
MLYLRSQFSFVIGVLMSKNNDREIMINKIISLVVILIVIAIREKFLKSMPFAPFSTIIFITLNVVSLISSYIINWIVNLAHKLINKYNYI